MSEKIKPAQQPNQGKEYKGMVKKLVNKVAVVLGLGSFALGCGSDIESPTRPADSVKNSGTVYANGEKESKQRGDTLELKPQEAKNNPPEPQNADEFIFINGNYVPVLDPLFPIELTGKGKEGAYNIKLKDSEAIAIVYGFKINWQDKHDGGERGGLVILEDGLYEGIVILDGAFDIYQFPKNLTLAQRENLKRKLAEGRAEEQHRRHGFPQKRIKDIRQWDSEISANTTGFVKTGMKIIDP